MMMIEPCDSPQPGKRKQIKFSQKQIRVKRLVLPPESTSQILHQTQNIVIIGFPKLIQANNAWLTLDSRDDHSADVSTTYRPQYVSSSLIPLFQLTGNNFYIDLTVQQ